MPILIDKDLLVISGDEYVLAYRFLGYERVSTVYLDELNDNTLPTGLSQSSRP